VRQTLPVHNELSLIAAFVNRNKRDRYREFVSNPRLRHKFTNQLAHSADFDPKYRLSILTQFRLMRLGVRAIVATASRTGHDR
jgi:hypothetical protein